MHVTETKIKIVITINTPYGRANNHFTCNSSTNHITVAIQLKRDKLECRLPAYSRVCVCANLGFCSSIVQQFIDTHSI